MLQLRLVLKDGNTTNLLMVDYERCNCASSSEGTGLLNAEPPQIGVVAITPHPLKDGTVIYTLCNIFFDNGCN